MTHYFKRLLQLVGASVAALAIGSAFAQISSVTDGTSSSTVCRSYSFNDQGVLRFDPPGCLGTAAPPPATPTYTFELANSTVVEDAGLAVIKVRRTGTDLTTAGSVKVSVSGGNAALSGNYNLFVPPFSATTLSMDLTFDPALAGVTMSERDFGVGIVNANQPGGVFKTLEFSLSTPTGGTLGTPVMHALKISSALPPPTSGDIALDGTVIPDSVPDRAYAAQSNACEFPGNPGFPGFGGKSPCGSYEIPVGNCNSGMLGGTDSVTNAFMFVHEVMKLSANTFMGGNSMRYPQHKNHAFVMKFKTGSVPADFSATNNLPPGAIGQLSFDFADVNTRGALQGDRYATISRTPCDFDYQKLDAGNVCYRAVSATSGNKMFAQIMNPGFSPSGYACALSPDTVYYLNIRWENPVGTTRGRNGCQQGTPYCGTSLGIL